MGYNKCCEKNTGVVNSIFVFYMKNAFGLYLEDSFGKFSIEDIRHYFPPKIKSDIDSYISFLSKLPPLGNHALCLEAHTLKSENNKIDFSIIFNNLCCNKLNYRFFLDLPDEFLQNKAWHLIQKYVFDLINTKKKINEILHHKLALEFDNAQFRSSAIIPIPSLAFQPSFINDNLEKGIIRLTDTASEVFNHFETPIPDTDMEIMRKLFAVIYADVISNTFITFGIPLGRKVHGIRIQFRSSNPTSTFKKIKNLLDLENHDAYITSWLKNIMRFSKKVSFSITITEGKLVPIIGIQVFNNTGCSSERQLKDNYLYRYLKYLVKKEEILCAHKDMIYNDWLKEKFSILSNEDNEHYLVKCDRTFCSFKLNYDLNSKSILSKKVYLANCIRGARLLL